MSSERRLPALDGVRGTAVLVVVAFHTLGGAQSQNLLVRLIGNSLKAGWSGVTLFFILSGFLITGILYDSQFEDGWLNRFYTRRAFRIFPLYYAVLILIFLGFVLQHQAPLGLLHTGILALYLTNLPSFFHVLDNFGGTLTVGHLWSLAIEEQFYLIWPFLILRARTPQRIANLCLSVFAISAIYRIAVPSPDSTAYGGFLLVHAGELAMGGYLAMCYRMARSWELVKKSAPVMSVLALIVFAATSIIWGFSSASVMGMAVLIPAATIFWAAFLVMSLSGGWVTWAMEMHLLRWFGGISYGLYIFHGLLPYWYDVLVAAIAPHASYITSRLLTAFVNLAVSTALAWISFRYFEEPIRDLGYKLKLQAAHNIGSPETDRLPRPGISYSCAKPSPSPSSP